jgi:metal-responsive CopG/Arc/MetJ family transcriptional regulator
MKTAISLPDRIFQRAEVFARRVQKSRSELYATAIAEYLARHSPDEITESHNRVVDRLPPDEDTDFLETASRTVLERTEW